jgi:hypothetical protein
VANPKTIRRLYAWIATEKDGSEGVPATSMELDGDPYIVPLLGADLDRIDSLLPQVRRVQAETGARMRLVRFDLAEEVATLADYKPGQTGHGDGGS